MVGHYKDETETERVTRMLERNFCFIGNLSEDELILALKEFENDNPGNDEKFPPIEKNEKEQIQSIRNAENYMINQIEQDLREMKIPLLDSEVIDLGRFGRYLRGEANHDGDWVDKKRIFATVGIVKPDSPADKGGLRKNDQLIEFGYISIMNFTDIHQLQNVVRLSIDRPLRIKVKRGRQLLNIVVTPQHWEQPGLVGCQIIKHRCGLAMAD